MSPGCLIQLDGQVYTLEVDTLHHRFFSGEGDFLHLHPSYHFILVSRGRCRMLLKDRAPIDVEENSFVFINPLVPHAFVGDPVIGVEHSCLIWKFHAADGTPALFPLQRLISPSEQDYRDFYIKPLSDFDARNFLLKQRSAERAGERAGYFAASMKIFELFFLGLNLIRVDDIDLAENVDNGKRIAARVEEVVEREIAHANFGVRTVARALGLNASYVNTAFKAATGMTITAFIVQRRIELAKIMLENTPYNLSEIADLCGFNHLCYFSRTFKRICGVSPQSYRNRKY